MRSDRFSLANKISFIVGGSGLIGLEVSKVIASAGSKTIILDINKKPISLLENEGKNILFEMFDSSDIENCEMNFNKTVANYGSPNIFINCSYPRTKDWGEGSFKDVTLKSFRENIDIHLNSYAWLARVAAEEMVRNGEGGSIVQFGSIYGIVGQDLTVYQGTDMHEHMTYSVIKGGIASLSRQMASYYGQFNIRVNTLCPGGLEGHVAGKSDGQSPAFVKQYSNKVPLKRLGKAEEVASATLFLASEASSYVSGATIMVDGGWTAI